MGCNCLSAVDLRLATTYIRCLRASLGAPAGESWDQAAHDALYAFVSRQVDVLSERRQDGPTIRAVPFGAEPNNAGTYAIRFGDWQGEGSSFWTCLGMTKADADRSRQDGGGTYWQMIRAAATEIGIAEAGGRSKDDSWPWWVWLLIAAGAVGVVAAVKD